MKLRIAALALPLTLALACDRQPASPDASRPAPLFQQQQGSGLILNSLTNVVLLGDIRVNQVELTNFTLVEDVVGQIVGLQVDGVIQLTGGVLGTNIVSEDFNTTVQLASSSSGKCSLLTLDLAPFDVNPLGLGIINVDLPAASVDAKSAGAVGSLLCALGQALLDPVTGRVEALVDAIDRLI